MRLTPDWVNELAGQWARSDRQELADDLGFPAVSPMWRHVAGTDSSQDVTGYSSAEVQAMHIAVEWLHLNHPEHWRALARELRPHLRRALPCKSGDTQLLLEAGPMLAAYIDRMLD